MIDYNERYTSALADLLNQAWNVDRISKSASQHRKFAADFVIKSNLIAQIWIPASIELPKEHNSIFADLYGTDKWQPAMFRTKSDDVITCVEYESGERAIKILHTRDGKWNINSVWQAKVTHWTPMPKLPKEE